MKPTTNKQGLVCPVRTVPMPQLWHKSVHCRSPGLDAPDKLHWRSARGKGGQRPAMARDSKRSGDSVVPIEYRITCCSSAFHVCCCLLVCLSANLNRPSRPPYKVPEIFHNSTAKKRKGKLFWQTFSLATNTWDTCLSSFSSFYLNTVEEEGPRPEEDPSVRVKTLLSLQI